jgi:hypothetical protein
LLLAINKILRLNTFFKKKKKKKKKERVRKIEKLIESHIGNNGNFLNQIEMIA